MMEVLGSIPAFRALLAPAEGGVGGSSSTSGDGRTSEGGSGGELVNVTLIVGIEKRRQLGVHLLYEAFIIPDTHSTGCKGGLLVETG